MNRPRVVKPKDPTTGNPYWHVVKLFIPFGTVCQPAQGDNGFNYFNEVMGLGFEERRQRMRLWEARDKIVREYSWSIPDPVGVKIVKEFCDGRIVEIGAGKGYWAFILAQEGIDIKAYDNYRYKKPWYPVERGDTESVCQHSDRTLLLCWPPCGEDMALKTLGNYQGNKLVYVGEWGGCTADDDFHMKLREEWTEVSCYKNTTWLFIKDRIHCLERKQPITVIKPFLSKRDKRVLGLAANIARYETAEMQGKKARRKVGQSLYMMYRLNCRVYKKQRGPKGNRLIRN